MRLEGVAVSGFGARAIGVRSAAHAHTDWGAATDTGGYRGIAGVAARTIVVARATRVGAVAVAVGFRFTVSELRIGTGNARTAVGAEALLDWFTARRGGSTLCIAHAAQ